MLLRRWNSKLAAIAVNRADAGQFSILTGMADAYSSTSRTQFCHLGDPSERVSALMRRLLAIQLVGLVYHTGDK